MIPFEVILLVLVGAALHAGWNTLVKAGDDKFLDVVCVASGAALYSLVLLPFVGWPAWASFPYLLVSAAIHMAYFGLVAAAYRSGDMSLAYPIMRGVAPLMVAAVAGVTIGERLTPAVAAGVGLISGGVLAMAFARTTRGPVSWPTIGFALLNAVVIAAYTLVDGVGARVSGNAVAYTMLHFVMDAIPLLAFLAVTRRRALMEQLASRARLMAIGGAATLGSYSASLWAMTVAPIAAVAALRETSILMALAFGFFILKEAVPLWRALGAVAILAGVVTFRLG